MSDLSILKIYKSNTASTTSSENNLSFLEEEKVKDSLESEFKKQKKKPKVSFIDMISNNDKKLVEIIPIESFKKYNFIRIIDGVIYSNEDYIEEDEENEKDEEDDEDEEKEEIEKYEGASGKSCLIF